MSERMNISVPDDLRKRMERVSKSEDVNWSQVAATAFEVKLAEIAAKKKEKVMEDVIQRLRASKMSSENSDYRYGYENGQHWAKNSADWADLERVANADEIGEAKDFLQTAFLPGEVDAQFLADFFADELGPDYAKPSEPMVRGFWMGAIDVYNEVKDKV